MVMDTLPGTGVMTLAPATLTVSAVTQEGSAKLPAGEEGATVVAPPPLAYTPLVVKALSRTEPVQMRPGKQAAAFLRRYKITRGKGEPVSGSSSEKLVSVMVLAPVLVTSSSIPPLAPG